MLSTCDTWVIKEKYQLAENEKKWAQKFVVHDTVTGRNLQTHSAVLILKLDSITFEINCNINYNFTYAVISLFLVCSCILGKNEY